jgi:hypothetical protein
MRGCLWSKWGDGVINLDTWRKRVIASLALALIVGLGVSTVFRAAISQVQRTDFTVYQLAGRAVLNGTDIYEVRNVRGWAYVYPPPFAILMAVFAPLSVFWGALLWYLISVALAAWAVAMCVKMVRGMEGLNTDPFVLAAVPVFLLLVYFLSGLARGQASVLVMWLVVAAFYWHWRKRDVAGGACLAGAVLLKVFPLVLLAYFAWQKRWRFLAATVVAIVLGALVLPASVFGWQKNLAYLQEWKRVVAQPALATETTREQSVLNEQLFDAERLRNQSLEVVLRRLTGGVGAQPLAIGIGLMMIGVIWLVGRQAPQDCELLTISSVLIWMLLVSPVSETHYFVLLLLPLVTLTALAMSTSDTRTRQLLRGVLVLFGMVSLLSAISRPLQTYGLLCWATLVLWVALLFVALRRQQSTRSGTTPTCEEKRTI